MPVSKELLEKLKAIDTPTLSNAIEKLKVRNPISGFCDRTLRCLFPELGVMCGFAVTAEAETIAPDQSHSEEGFCRLCEALDKAPKPAVIVIKEISGHPEKSAHCGEILSTVFARLGGVGVVSDSAVRDIDEVREIGMHYFAPGLVASHANCRIVRVQTPVTVCGLQIAPGDLLHGDVNGLISVPTQGVEELPRLVDEVLHAEQEFLELVKSDSFTLQQLVEHLTH